jgi:predicted RNase H-like nuclease (RuvC/YqgF family)
MTTNLGISGTVDWMSVPKDDRQAEKVHKLEKEVETLRDQLDKALAEVERLRKELEETLQNARCNLSSAYLHVAARKTGVREGSMLSHNV